MMNMQTCMSLNQFKTSIHALMSRFFSKQGEIMDLNIIMSSHVTFCHENNLKFNNPNMHAWNELQFNIIRLRHDLAPQLDMNHARINLNTTMRG